MRGGRKAHGRGTPGIPRAHGRGTIGILRAKGFVETSEGLRLVQVVGRRIELTEPETPPPAKLLNKLIVIQRSGKKTQ